MDLNARVDVNCERKDGLTDGLTENWKPISHIAKAGAELLFSVHYLKMLYICSNFKKIV